MALLSAYIPVFNNGDTVSLALHSIASQSVTPAEVLVVDDGSTDDTVMRALEHKVRVISLDRNLGRGTARARAMKEACHEFVLCCDATNALEADFVSKALPWFEDERVAAVFGKITQAPGTTAAERWRGRHLFKERLEVVLNRKALFATWGAIARKSAVMAVGNFAPDLRHSEDSDLGERLLGGGFDVIYDPNLTVTSLKPNGIRVVLERYWRWYAGKNEAVSFLAYLRQIVYSVKVLARADWRAADPWCVPISLLSPHYQFWRSLLNRCRGGA